MKRVLLLVFASLSAFSASAQLKVDLDGKVSVGNCQPLTNANLNLGASTQPSNYRYGICTRLIPTTGLFNIGIGCSAYSNTTSTSGRTIGVQGVAGNYGSNFGVIGMLSGTKDGAGIFGTLTNTTGIAIIGKYAGYFDGNVRVTGSVRSPSLVTISDNRLKENVTSLVSEIKTQDETLNKIMNMNVIKYNYVDQTVEESDTAQLVVQRESEEKQTHYGVSVQDLQELYPDLVCEGQDGYIGVNYIELVPILVRGIQELKQELDAVKGDSNDVLMSREGVTAVTSVSQTTGNILYQNTPNPFKEQTIINFKLADNARNAAIFIFDMTGKILKKLPISSGESSVKVNGWELGEGMFLYTLMVNGKEIDTKRMLIKK